MQPEDLDRALQLGSLVPHAQNRIHGWGLSGSGGKRKTKGAVGDVAALQQIISRVRGRPGQQQFREKLLEAYGYACAITRCKVEDALTAAHIKDYANSKSQKGNEWNSPALADIHVLFDLQLLHIYPETRRGCDRQ